MIKLTIEEMNLLSIYHEGSKAQLMENMTAALPFMDEDMRPFAERTQFSYRSVSPLPLCSNTDFLFICCTREVHAFLIWQV